VSPFEVEHTLNPVIFPSSKDRAEQPKSVQVDERTTSGHPIARIERFELDAEESQFDALNGPLVMAIDGIPHQWESTLGSDRRFFDAERDLLKARRKRRRNDSTLSDDAQRWKGKARQMYEEPSQPRDYGGNTEGQSSREIFRCKASRPKSKSDILVSTEKELNLGILCVHP
jgi:hypothetical protein